MPELVVDGEDGYKQIHLHDLPYYTIQSIKEQQQQIEELKKENEEMKARLLVLEERMNKTGV